MGGKWRAKTQTGIRTGMFALGSWGPIAALWYRCEKSFCISSQKQIEKQQQRKPDNTRKVFPRNVNLVQLAVVLHLAVGARLQVSQIRSDQVRISVSHTYLAAGPWFASVLHTWFIRSKGKWWGGMINTAALLLAAPGPALWSSFSSFFFFFGGAGDKCIYACGILLITL